MRVKTRAPLAVVTQMNVQPAESLSLPDRPVDAMLRLPRKYWDRALSIRWLRGSFRAESGRKRLGHGLRLRGLRPSHDGSREVLGSPVRTLAPRTSHANPPALSSARWEGARCLLVRPER